MTSYTWTDTGQPLSKTEAKEVDRLWNRYHLIRTLGAGALVVEREKEELQERRQTWVTQHGLRCFQCGATLTDWAAGGRNKWGKLWALCATCVRKPKEKEAGSEATL